ncbi:MAG: hypothetical protein GF320_09650 [Armatimonadia bacterium]|nr:hypothetical protein [Armatimonadia bacterium]
MRRWHPVAAVAVVIVLVALTSYTVWMTTSRRGGRAASVGGAGSADLRVQSSPFVTDDGQPIVTYSVVSPPGTVGGFAYVLFLRWNGHTVSSGASQTTEKGEGVRVQRGIAIAARHIEVDFQVDATAGLRDSLTVDGTRFDLAKGRVLTIDPYADEVVVRQHDLKLPPVPPGDPQQVADRLLTYLEAQAPEAYAEIADPPLSGME